MNTKTFLKRTTLIGACTLMSFGSVFAQTEAKPTTTQYRIKAITNRQFDTSAFQLKDSTAFYWSDTHHMPANYYKNNYFPLPDPLAGQINPTRFPVLETKDSSVIYKWNSDSLSFERYTKDMIGLNGQGLVATHIKMMDMGFGLENLTKYIYNYDAQGNLTSREIDHWNGSGWDKQMLRIFTYNNSKMSSNIRDHWNTGTNSWDSVYKQVYTYDGNGRLTDFLSQNWSAGSWVNSTKTSIFYSGNQRDSSLIKTWDNISTSWNNNQRKIYTYTNSGQIKTDESYHWSSGAWVGSQKKIYSYNGNDNIISSVYQNWNSGSWINQIKSEFSYSNGQNTQKINYSWDNVNSNWGKSNRTRLTYNNNDLCTLGITDRWDGSQWASGQFDRKVNFYYDDYDDGQTGIDNILKDNVFTVYPNPVKSQIHIKMNKGKVINAVMITDMTGRVVFKSQGNFSAESVALPTANLTNGVYVLQIKSGLKTGSKTFVVQH